MITANEVLSQTDAGHPAGKLLRAFWQPIALVKEIHVANSTQKLRVMGEDLVLSRDRYSAFRLDSSDGKASYPCQDVNGLVFACLGDYEKPSELPSLPDMDFYVAHPTHCYASSGLGSNAWYYGLQSSLADTCLRSWQAGAEIDCDQTIYGIRVASHLKKEVADEDHCHHVSISNFIFPNAVSAPQGNKLVRMVWFVPVEEHSHRWFALWYKFGPKLGDIAQKRQLGNYSPRAEFPPASFPTVAACRELLVNALITLLEDGRAPFLLDGVERKKVRGPPTLQLETTDAQWRMAWRTAEMERRERSPWGWFVNADHWRWT